MAFHWHGETSTCRPVRARLASSVACENQAFQLGPNVVGVQFHLETTADSLDAIASACRNELVEARFVQSEATIRAAQPEAYAEINALMSELLGYVTRDDVTRAAPATRGGRVNASIGRPFDSLAGSRTVACVDIGGTKVAVTLASQRGFATRFSEPTANTGGNDALAVQVLRMMKVGARKRTCRRIGSTPSGSRRPARSSGATA